MKRALKRKERAELHGHVHQRPAARAAHASPTRRAPLMKKRALQYMVSGRLPALPRQAAPPRVAVGDVRRPRHRRDLPACRWSRLAGILRPTPTGRPPAWRSSTAEHPEKAMVVRRIAQDLAGRLAVLLDLGLGYLSLERSTPDALARRAAAAAAGDAGPLQPVRRGLRARRAVGRAAPGRHRGAAAGARPPEGRRATRSSSSSTTST